MRSTRDYLSTDTEEVSHKYPSGRRAFPRQDSHLLPPASRYARLEETR
jgi:hypothetical protein